MSNGFTGTPRKKIALDNGKFNLSAPSTAEGKTASLTWGLHKNNPRIIVWTRDPQDMTEKNGNGKIQAELDMPVMLSLIESLELAIIKEPGWRAKLENKNYTYFGGKRSDAPVVLTEIWVGKDKEGYVFLSVTAPNRPTIKFKVAPSSFHHWFNSDGSQYTPQQISEIYAKGYAQMLRHVYLNLAVTEFVDVQAEKQQKQGGQGGGWNNNRNQNNAGGGGWNKQPAQTSSDQDDDLPF
jgi:hypothetical protein